MSQYRYPAARCEWRIRCSRYRKPIGRFGATWLEGSAVAGLLALLLAFIATQSIGRRLLRITDFAERVAAGDFLPEFKRLRRRDRRGGVGAG